MRRNPSGFNADIKARCNEVRLPAEAAGKLLVALPVATRAGRVSDKTLARKHVYGACAGLGLR